MRCYKFLDYCSLCKLFSWYWSMYLTTDSATKHFDVSMIATYVHLEGIKLF